MSSSIFITVPKERNFKIPFKLKEEFLLDWLLGLSKHNTRDACLYILQLVQALNEIDLAVKTRISFLKTSHDYLKQYMAHLEGSCWDASLPLTAKEQDYADVILWNYLILSEGFFIAAQDAGIKSEELFALYMASFCLGQAQLHTAAVYSNLTDGFWTLAYKIFSWGEKHKLLDMPINESNLKNITLTDMMAQSVIFYLCDTNQFRPRDMRTIFNFLPKVCGDLVVYKISDVKFQTDVLKISYLQAVANNFGNIAEKISEKVNDCQDLVVFDLNKDIPPTSFNKNHSLTESSLRYFTVTTVLENLKHIIDTGEMWSGILKSMNHELFSRVVKNLEPGKKRQHARSIAGYVLLGVIGFENIISFLYKINKSNYKNHLADTSGLGHKASSYEELKVYADKIQPQMGAIDGGFGMIDFAFPAASDNAIWDNKNAIDITKRQVVLKKLNIFDSSAKGYSVYWTDDESSKAKIGDIFGIISEDKKRLEIAIIRRIAMSAGENYKFGTEVLGFESEVVIVTLLEDQSTGGWGIFIPGVRWHDQADSILYNLGDFQTGHQIFIHRQHKTMKAVLTKELNATSAIAHSEISYSLPEENEENG
jgi:hypothetical protein